MRIALIAPPFIPVPPIRYGGTELFIAQLAEGLQGLGIDVVVYTNGESTVGVEKRWIYETSQWPIKGEVYANLQDINHTSWSVTDAWQDCDLIHLNNAPGLAFSRWPGGKFVYTVHHPHDATLSEFYDNFPEVQYVTISRFQQARERMPRVRTIHHGVDLDQYIFRKDKEQYLAFLGRIAPMKGTHIAIEVAKKAGMPLKIAGEVQPAFQDYFETQVKPHIDGKFIEYIGEADLVAKNELLSNAAAMLFPIQWDEPFGLVMIEAMATGTPVIALPGGSVSEIVADGTSGYICRSIDEMVTRMAELSRLSTSKVRLHVEQNFSVERMVNDYARLYGEVIKDRGGFAGTTSTGGSDDLDDSRAVA